MSGSIIYNESGSGSFMEGDEDEDLHPIYIIFIVWIGLILSIIDVAVLFYIIAGLFLLYQYYIKACFKDLCNYCRDCVGGVCEMCGDCLNNLKITLNYWYMGCYSCFKKRTQTKVISVCESNKVCSICLSNNNINSITLKCNHNYHKFCLKEWTKQCKKQDNLLTCPLCRKDIV